MRAATRGVRLAVRVTPRARSDRIVGVARDQDGEWVLKVAVAAPPAEGRANDALLRLIAREWDVSRRDLAVVAGAASRNKLIHIAGDPAVVAERLQRWLQALPAA